MNFTHAAPFAPDFITVLFIAMAALGLFLVHRGWRGRRVDNHPWCRKCRHDLHGLWPGAAKCPECGVDLERIDAVELGQRARRPIAAVLGCVLLLLCVSWLGAGVWRGAGAIKWAQFKPDWWLVREARSTDADTAESAMRTLRERMDKGSLGADHIAELVQTALSTQGDANATWNAAWGDIALEAWTDGRLTPEETLQFAQRAVSISPDLGAGIVRQWDLSPMTLRFQSDRAPSGSLEIALTPIEVLIGGTPIPMETQPSEPGRLTRRSSRTYMLPIVVEPGEYEMRMAWRVQAIPASAGVAPVTWDVQSTTPIKVLPPAESAAELVVGPAANRMMLDHLKFQAVGFRLSPSRRSREGSMIMLLMSVDEAPLSAELRFDTALSTRGPRRNMSASILIGRSYRARWELSGLDDSITELTLKIEPQVRPSAGGNTPSWQGQQVWYSPTLETPPMPVAWYDSIDDPLLPAELREMCLQPEGWLALTPAGGTEP